MMAKNSAMLVGGLILAASVVAAHADVKISKKPTQNMQCSHSVCSPTKKKAVLNATDLANMLAAGNITVASDALAQDIVIDAALSWTSQHRLTLDSFHSIAVNKPVTVAGNGELTITTNDGGTGGDYRFFGKGHVEFWGTKNSPIIINNQPYLVAAGITKLRSLINHGNTGFYALAKDIDAKGEQYSGPPIDEFQGTLEGLGNRILNLTIMATDRANVAFIGGLANSATVRDIGLVDVSVTGVGTEECVAALVGTNQGPAKVLNSYATGVISAKSTGSIAGGLICNNLFGTVERSWTNVSVSAVGDDVVGGLIGSNQGAFCPVACDGVLIQSYSFSAVSGGNGAVAGGLVGRNLGGLISNSYATSAVTGGSGAMVGGLIGSNENNDDSDSSAEIASSYSTGTVSGGTDATLGGLIGQDIAQSQITSTYWDLDTSGISDPTQGAGNVANDPGITGLTDEQLKSGLPTGFDPAMWAQNSKINNGYPYLIAIPPPK